MTTNLERIEYELRKAGYTLEDTEHDNSDNDFAQSIGKCVWDICKLFASQEHSGFSAKLTLSLLQKVLIDEQTLTPLTNNPDEWQEDTSGEEGHYQSKRRFSCFSDDNLKTYYDIDDPYNFVIEKDENGVEWQTFKKEMKHIPLESVK